MKKIYFGIASVLIAGFVYASGIGGGGSGGGSGITSINSDTTAAHSITGSNNISASTSGGTTTVNGTLLAPKANPTFSGTIGTALTASKAVTTDASGNLSTGTITVAQGGTGLATLTSNNVLLGNGTSNVAFVAPSTSGNLLTSDGTTWTSAAPAAASVSYPLLATPSSAAAPPYSFSGGSGSNAGLYDCSDGNGDGVCVSTAGAVKARFTEFLTGYYAEPGLLLGSGSTPVHHVLKCANANACNLNFNPGTVQWELGPNSSGSVNAFTLYNGSVGLVWEFNSNTSKMNLKTGQSSTTTGGVGSNLKTDTTAVGNVGAGPDTLITYTIPASVLTTNNDRLEWEAFGTSTSGTYTVTCKYGSTTLVSTGSVAFAGADWHAKGTIIRTGATTQIANSEIKVNGVVDITDYTTPGETLSGTVAILCNADGTASDNDVVQKALTVKWYPAN